MRNYWQHLLLGCVKNRLNLWRKMAIVVIVFVDSMIWKKTFDKYIGVLFSFKTKGSDYE